jgi:hypothetical protein
MTLVKVGFLCSLFLLWQNTSEIKRWLEINVGVSYGERRASVNRVQAFVYMFVRRQTDNKFVSTVPVLEWVN